MRYAFLFFLFAARPAAAQTATDEVLNAEKSFAARSVSHGAKAAFLSFLDSTGVVFENGKILNGRETWSQKDSIRGVLNWRPVYGFAAASGDLGFTTGPWTVQPKTTADPVTAQGQYTTVWKKNGAGEWRFVVDMGIDRTPPFPDKDTVLRSPKISFVKGTWNNLLNREQRFIRETATATAGVRIAVYQKSVGNGLYFLNCKDRLPATADHALQAAVRLLPAAVAYTIAGSGISAAGDLGYVYGTTVINEKAGNYLRIWRREGKEWKLALEVLP